MATRRYTIKQTKSPNMYVSLLEASKGAVQASSLGLKPKLAEVDKLRTDAELKSKPGTLVAYELANDGTELRFEMLVGGKQIPLGELAKVKLRDLSLPARLEVLTRLYEYHLATADEVAAAEAATLVDAKEHELNAAKTTAATFGRELKTMKSEKRIRDLSAASGAKFRAWAESARLGGPITLLDLVDRGGWSADMFDAKTIAYIGLSPASRKTIAKLEAGDTPDLRALEAEVLKKLDEKMLRGYHADRVAREIKPGLGAAAAAVKRLETELKELRKLAGR